MVETLQIAFLIDHPQHLETIARWVFDEWGYLRPGFGLVDAEAEFRERMRRDRVPLALIALDGDEVVGCVSIKSDEDLTRPGLSPWIGALYVRSDRRGRGIGLALLSRAEEVAREIGLSTLYLSATDAENFYQRLGWMAFERLVSQGEEVVIMRRDLSRRTSG